MNNANTAPQLAADDGLQVAHPMPAEHEKMPAAGYHQSPVSHYAQTPTNMSVYAAIQAGAVSPPPPVSSYPESHAYERSPEEQRRKSVPWGLSPWLFAAIAALIGMLISGAIVGGVMGSMLANNDQSSRDLGSATGSPVPASTTPGVQPPPPSSTSTSTTSSSTSSGPTALSSPSAPLDSYSVAAPRDVERLAWDCPRLDKATVTAFGDARFSLECGRDSQGTGREAAGALSVIVAHWAYSLDDCLDSCASMNARSASARRDLRCRLVVFRNSMKATVDNGGNCFLKNATRAAGNNGIGNEFAVTASLVTS
ncbi:hypothetical protein RB595_008628 [Gaeumannomyces hyphopodioides]